MSTDDTKATDPRMTYNDVVGCIRANLQDTVRREMKAAKIRVVEEMANQIRSLPMVLGDGWEQVEGATAIAEDLVDAAMGTDPNADSHDLAIDHEITQHGLGLRRTVSREARAELVCAIHTAVPVSVTTVFANRTTYTVPGITALEVTLGKGAGSVEEALKAALQEWALRFNTSTPDLYLRLEEDADDTLRVEVSL